MKLKSIFAAAVLLVASGAANAGLSFSALSSATRTEAFNVSGLPSYAVGTGLSLGSLVTDQQGTISFTFLGQESGYVNALNLTINGTSLFESNAVGTTISAFVSNLGAVNFRFTENTGPANYAVNGGYWAPNTSIGLVGQNMTFGRNSYAYVLGYNDSAGTATLGDWDDFVVGVNFTPSPIPEPEIYAMMAAGLGFIGWAKRRNKKQSA